MYDGAGNKFSQHEKAFFKLDRITREVTAVLSNWRCTSRTTHCPGRAQKIQKPPGSDPVFTLTTGHTCQPEIGIEFKDRLYLEAKKQGLENLEKPALAIALPLLAAYHESHPDLQVPKPATLERYINDSRKPIRLTAPKDLGYDIKYVKQGFPPNFYRSVQYD